MDYISNFNSRVHQHHVLSSKSSVIYIDKFILGELVSAVPCRLAQVVFKGGGTN